MPSTLMRCEWCTHIVHRCQLGEVAQGSVSAQGRHMEFCQRSMELYIAIVDVDFIIENATRSTQDPAVYDNYSTNQETLQHLLSALYDNSSALWQHQPHRAQALLMMTSAQM